MTSFNIIVLSNCVVTHIIHSHTLEYQYSCHIEICFNKNDFFNGKCLIIYSNYGDDIIFVIDILITSLIETSEYVV